MVYSDAAAMPTVVRARPKFDESADRSAKVSAPQREGLLPAVLIISEVLLYREGVAAGLQQCGRLRVAGAVAGSAALARLAGGDVAAVLLDVSGQDALGLARTIKQRWPALAIVGFGIADDALGVACAEAGLTGFVGADGTVERLAETVLQALAGQVGCTPQMAALLCDRLASLARRPAPMASPLTAREREIATLVSDGLSNKEIAATLRIGPATVKNHVHNILDKLGVRRRGAIANRLRAAHFAG